ncbi:hypothetical protein BU075_01865 [Mammaliicoccus vitulinus]|nr:hypothetical protein BU075_01865 [Mammaliicoccus vitulinus]
MARACSLSHILFPRASALYKIRNIKSPNPKMMPTDWVIYFELCFYFSNLLSVISASDLAATSIQSSFTSNLG